MKKLIISFMLVILLTACQSASAPAPTTEEPAKMKEQLYGIWYYPGGENYFMEITSSGFKMYVGLGNLIVAGTYSFDAGKFSWDKNDYCKDGATYEITLVLQDGNVIAMRPTLIGDDTCTDRKLTFDGKTYKRVGP